MITDETGLLAGEKETVEYMPFGGMRQHGGSEVVSDYKFTDQELDNESGLYNYDARLYDPVIGRFASPDPHCSPNLYSQQTGEAKSNRFNCQRFFFTPQNLNRYSYVLNNPLKYIDPTGKDWNDPNPNKPGNSAVQQDLRDLYKTYIMTPVHLVRDLYHNHTNKPIPEDTYVDTLLSGEKI